MDYDNYLAFLNHLFLERMIDDNFQRKHPASTVDALTVL